MTAPVSRFRPAWQPWCAAAAALTLLLLSGCAGQRAPEGGPVDTEPPEIVSVYPAPNTVNFADTRIALEFSEYVDRASVEKALFISPYVSDIEFAWSGREVEILFHEGLRANTTYVMTLGTDIVDYHNRNRMAHAFTLAFSTGGAIDRGMITGRVFNPKPEGIMLFAYRLDDLRADTLNPMHTSPDYLTQTGADGTFTLAHLRFGTYRVEAVRDEYRDLLYTPEVDAAGTFTRDIRLSAADTLMAGCNFTLALEDTSSPRLLSAEARDVRHVVLKFSENLDTASVAASAVTVTDTLTGRALAFTHAFIEDPSVPQTLIVRTDVQRPNAGYRVRVDGVRDRALHPVAASANALVFASSERPDTAAPRLIAGTLRDTLSRMMPEGRFRFDFSDAVMRGPLTHAFQFRLGDTAAVPFTLEPSATGVVLHPRETLAPKSRYVIRMQYDSIRSVSGFALKDSMRIFRYTTIDPENFSSIDGRIEDASLPDTSETVVEAFNTAADKTAVAPIRTMMRKDGSFTFPMLGEGLYALRAFSDFNRNGMLDAGRLVPFRTSEPFIVGRDTVKVRPRWPVEGVILRQR